MAKFSGMCLNFQVAWKDNFPKKNSDHTNVQFSRKMTFILGPNEEQDTIENMEFIPSFKIGEGLPSS